MTRNVRFSNNAVSKLASSITSTSTTITLQTGDGSKFPTLTGSQYFLATLVKSDGSTEVVKVTARSGDVLTVVRAAEAVGSTQTAYAFSTGDRIEHRLTAGALASELDRLDQAAYINPLNKSANYTVTAADVTSLIRVNTGSGAVTITLPQISTLTDDFDVIVAKVTSDANTVTVARSGTDVINGATTYALTNQWQGAWLTADRSTGTWTVIASGGGGVKANVETFTGSGTAGPFTLSGDPGIKENTAVYVGGVYQQKSTYTLSGTSLTLGGTVATGVPIEVIWSQPIQIGYTTANQVGFTPTGGLSSTTVQAAIAEVVSDLAASGGSSLVGYMPAGTDAVATTVQEVLREIVSVKRFGAVGDWNGSTGTDDTAAIQKAITYLAINGGGVVKGIAGKSSYVAGTIVVPSNVTLEFGAYTLFGNGSNTLIESGYVSGTTVISNISEYGVSGDGSGTHFVQNGVIRGVTLANASIGMRLHRFNYGCVVDGCKFAASLASRSVLVTHSWSLSFTNNYVGRLARFQDFVDWTTIQGNSFENTGTTALSIGTGGFGGSYSCKIVQNGFHGNQTAIQVATECYNLEISSCHFENNVTAIDGDSLTKSNWSIHNNWIKANLSTPNSCVGIQSSYLSNSRVWNNTFTTDGSSTFSSIVTLNTQNIQGVEVDVPYVTTPTGTIPAGYTLANTVLVRKLMGTNDAEKSQPQAEMLAGSGSYTFEKYISKYNFVANTIPLCTISNNGSGTYYIDTFVDCDAYGIRAPVMFDVLISGSQTYICMGFIGRFDILNLVNKELYSGGAGLTVTTSNNGGKLRITLAGAPVGSSVYGLVKAL